MFFFFAFHAILLRMRGAQQASVGALWLLFLAARVCRAFGVPSMRTHIQLHGQQRRLPSSSSDYSDALTISQPRCVPKWLPLLNKKWKKQQQKPGAGHVQLEKFSHSRQKNCNGPLFSTLSARSALHTHTSCRSQRSSNRPRILFI